MKIANENEQWTADSSRLLKIGLRGHDPETMIAIRERIAEKYDTEFADASIAQTITLLMDKENFSFIDNNGNPSPLI